MTHNHCNTILIDQWQNYCPQLTSHSTLGSSDFLSKCMCFSLIIEACKPILVDPKNVIMNTENEQKGPPLTITTLFWKKVCCQHACVRRLVPFTKLCWAGRFQSHYCVCCHVLPNWLFHINGVWSEHPWDDVFKDDTAQFGTSWVDIATISWAIEMNGEGTSSVSPGL